MILRRASACLFFLCLSLRAPGAQPAPAAGVPAMPLVPTVIESGAAEMVSSETETRFTFTGGVKVTGTNLLMTCDFLEVIALRAKENPKDDPRTREAKERDSGSPFANPENFKSLIATGNVRIVQSDREALCARAEVLPGDNKVILTGDPRVRSTDGSYQASGAVMELRRGERTARILGDGNQRPQFILPPLKDLGYEKEKEKEKKPAPPPAAGTDPAATPVAPPPITVPLGPAPR